jgi:hypothetical protein
LHIGLCVSLKESQSGLKQMNFDDRKEYILLMKLIQTKSLFDHSKFLTKKEKIKTIDESLNSDYYRKLDFMSYYNTGREALPFTTSEIETISDLIVGFCKNSEFTELSLSTETGYKIIEFSSESSFKRNILGRGKWVKPHLTVNQKLINSFSNRGGLNLKKIFGNSGIKLETKGKKMSFLLHKEEDEWFMVHLMVDYGRSNSLTNDIVSFWECDQLEGLLEFLKKLFLGL